MQTKLSLEASFCFTGVSEAKHENTSLETMADLERDRDKQIPSILWR
jgi:hypothetical protein